MRGRRLTWALAGLTLVVLVAAPGACATLGGGGIYCFPESFSKTCAPSDGPAASGSSSSACRDPARRSWRVAPMRGGPAPFISPVLASAASSQMLAETARRWPNCAGRHPARRGLSVAHSRG